MSSIMSSAGATSSGSQTNEVALHEKLMQSESTRQFLPLPQRRGSAKRAHRPPQSTSVSVESNDPFAQVWELELTLDEELLLLVDELVVDEELLLDRELLLVEELVVDEGLLPDRELLLVEELVVDEGLLLDREPLLVEELVNEPEGDEPPLLFDELLPEGGR